MNILLAHGHQWADVLEMNFWQMTAYVEAAERDDLEKLVLNMNAMAVAFGGTAKQRKEMAQTLLNEGTPEFDSEGFDALFGNLATAVPPDDPTAQWAKAEIEADTSGLLK